FNTIVFADTDNNPDVLQGQPLDVAWFDQKLYVLHKVGANLLLSIFDENQNHQTHLLSEDAMSSLDKYSMHIEAGQIHLALPQQHNIYKFTQTGGLELIYWQQREEGGELFVQGGQIYSSNEDGVVQIKAHRLAISSITPPVNSSLTVSDSILVQFNSLIDTSEQSIASAITLKDEQGIELESSHYTLTAINTLLGAQVSVGFSDLMPVGNFTLEVNASLMDLDGLNLVQAVSHSLKFTNEAAPKISSVARKVGEELAGHYFHADGTEKALIQGANFNDTKNIWVGDTQLTTAQINVLSDTQIEIDVPDLFKGQLTASIALKVENQVSRTTMLGALTVLPVSGIESFYPHTGPPQGGNTLDIYGYGFNKFMQVKIADNQASNLKVINSNHIQVKTPSGVFGFANVSINNPYFVNENTSAIEQYFYAGQATGTVLLPDDKPSPVAAIAYQNQLLYSVTGGQFTPRSREGIESSTIYGATARLNIIDVADPVKPEVLSKESAGSYNSYHFEAPFGDGRFVDVEVDNNLLVTAAEKRVFIFDVTLATDPFLLTQVETQGTIRDISVHQGMVYIAHSYGVDIYRSQDDQFEKVASISNSELGGSANKISIDGYKLWVVQTLARRIVSIDLRTQEYKQLNVIETVDATGRRIRPYDFIKAEKSYFVASGPLGTVQAYLPTVDNKANLAGEAKLAYLVPNGDLSADRITLIGQTIYVAAQEGDIQLFNASNWL
ncbi:MAG: IPT/TIG domain-containing protein, partial [Colwellia sp.]